MSCEYCLKKYGCKNNQCLKMKEPRKEEPVSKCKNCEQETNPGYHWCFKCFNMWNKDKNVFKTKSNDKLSFDTYMFRKLPK